MESGIKLEVGKCYTEQQLIELNFAMVGFRDCTVFYRKTVRRGSTIVESSSPLYILESKGEQLELVKIHGGWK